MPRLCYQGTLLYQASCLNLNITASPTDSINVCILINKVI
ncbi:hypothetical protein GNVKYODX_CDS73 [Acinetobacter phage vB_AbaM_AB3P2]|nr:hypothetical protein GNVKYODX_CDS73 [Acinetobacter phage vB_AbaM_AB3P2]